MSTAYQEKRITVFTCIQDLSKRNIRLSKKGIQQYSRKTYIHHDSLIANGCTLAVGILYIVEVTVGIVGPQDVFEYQWLDHIPQP